MSLWTHSYNLESPISAATKTGVYTAESKAKLRKELLHLLKELITQSSVMMTSFWCGPQFVTSPTRTFGRYDIDTYL
jgi:hypothetical protein